MKLCILSNSHAACLKHGWEKIQDQFTDIDITFFAAPNRLMADLVTDFNANKIVAESNQIKRYLSFTAEGINEIDVEQYDAFLVYGLFLSVPRLKLKHSMSLKMATVHDSVSDSINVRLVNDLCTMTDVPVYYSANPLLSDLDETMTEAPSGIYHSYSEICDWIDNRYNHRNAVQLRQSGDTIGDLLTTKAVYSKGSYRLTPDPIQHVKHDAMHMNAEYGALFMKMFLDIESVRSASLTKSAA